MVSTDKSQKILFVEDDKLIRKVYSIILREIGYEVDTAEDGKEALAMYTKDNYSLIFMDIRLPDISGMDVAMEIRRWEEKNKKKRVPIIAVTAFSLDYVEDKCLSAGMDRVVTKPVSSDAWERMISEFTETVAVG